MSADLILLMFLIFSFMVKAFYCSHTDTSLPLNQSCRLAQERGAVGRSEVLVGDRRRIRTIRFHKFFSTLCRWLQPYVMVAIV